MRCGPLEFRGGENCWGFDMGPSGNLNESDIIDRYHQICNFFLRKMERLFRNIEVGQKEPRLGKSGIR